ncbi:hypothetical protein ACFX1R_036141 [Malus domestica]
MFFYSGFRGILGPVFMFKGAFYVSGLADLIIPRWSWVSWMVVISIAIMWWSPPLCGGLKISFRLSMDENICASDKASIGYLFDGLICRAQERKKDREELICN